MFQYRFVAVAVMTLCAPVQNALAIEPPVPQSLVEWLTRSSLAELLGPNHMPAHQPSEPSTGGVQIKVLVNQCTPEFEPPDLFVTPKAVADVMGLTLAPTPRPTLTRVADLPGPQVHETPEVTRLVPLPLPRPAMVEQPEVATLPFQPRVEPASPASEPASSPISEPDPGSDVAPEPQVIAAPPIPAARPDRQTSAPRPRPEMPTQAIGSFITFAVTEQPGPPTGSGQITQLSPSIIVLQ